MTLVPDKGRPIFPLEKNVNITQGGTKPNAAYDLALYEELGSKGARAVLVVGVIIVFDFVDTSVAWADAEKVKFMEGVKKQCELAWGEKFELTTKNSTPPAKTAGVIFDIQTKDGGSLGFKFGHGHWNVKCRKVDGSRMSLTKPGGGGCLSNGSAEWDSLDLTPEARPGASIMQRAAVHEFGHMLGYRDEYPPPAAPTPAEEQLYSKAHLADVDSIMYWGEKVRPRHYVFFADWISLKWIAKDNKNCKGHDWKVDGTIDTMNAGLS